LIEPREDWIDLFATPYHFCCEADDRMNAVAFGMRLDARINAFSSSDIDQFDLVMRDPLPEAYELVQDGLATFFAMMMARA
jgi:hypothetical protein